MGVYWEGDGITLYHGDCLEILPTLEGIGAVITDPPYSSGGQFRGDRAATTTKKYVSSDTFTYRPDFAGDNRDQRSFLVWCSMWMGQARAISQPGAPLCCFTDWRQLPTFTDAAQCAGWTWRNIATWHKPGSRMQRGRFSGSAEYLIYCSNGPCGEGADSPQNVLAHPPAPKDKQHIAEKPLPVMQWVLGVVPSGAVVLDPFAGSGSTLVAAKKRGLRAVGVEVDERYCELAASRLAQGVLM
jgi:site-specific DNA-methyltransferase (adenine-specific)